MSKTSKLYGITYDAVYISPCALSRWPCAVFSVHFCTPEHIILTIHHSFAIFIDELVNRFRHLPNFKLSLPGHISCCKHHQ